MRVVQQPECVELLPETDQEKELLKNVHLAIGQSKDRLIQTADLDENGVLILWKF